MTKRTSAAAESSGNYLLEICPQDDILPLLKSGREDLPGSIFSLEERSRFRTLKTEKRRRDWLAGRVAAKRVLRRYLSRLGPAPEHHQIEICNNPDGSPFVRCGRAVNISLSHCDAGGLAIASDGNTLIGADWETVARRPASLLKTAFHESERSQQFMDSPELQTRLWTLKEAVIKLLSCAGTAEDEARGLGHLPEIRLAGAGPLSDMGPVLKLTGAARRLWERLGSPMIRLETHGRKDALIGVAYAEPVRRSALSRPSADFILGKLRDSSMEPPLRNQSR